MTIAVATAVAPLPPRQRLSAYRWQFLGGPGWQAADDWAAIAAACIIFFNGTRILRPAVADLMDHAPETALLSAVDAAARSVDGVDAIEKLKMRKAGMGYFVDLHVQADPSISLRDAHILSGRVKSAIREAVPTVLGVLVHMEPFEVASVAAAHHWPSPTERIR